MSGDDRATGGWRSGARVGLTLAVPTAALGVSFGAFAVLADWPPVAAIVMSTLVLSGSAQFAFITAVTGGAGLATGVGAGSLMFSHVNDTGFWMFKEYFNLSLKQTFGTWTLMESIISVLGLAGVLILNVFIH